MRVGIVALLHESNTFVREPTALERFEEDVLATGEDVRQRFAGAPHEVGGFLAGLEAAGIEAVPLFAARATPSGPIAAAAHARLLERMVAQLERAGPLDGVLAAAHGAAVAEGEADADGRWLGMLRRRLGPRRPLVATLDLHANLSPGAVAACDAIVAYRTNPHLDQRERGEEAAALLGRALRGEARPTLAAAHPPLAVPIDCQETAAPPCRAPFELAGELRGRPGVLGASILLGFPYADVEAMGAATIVVTDGDAGLARRLAAELAGELWRRRAGLLPARLGVEAAIDRAAALPGPVLLLDMGDNVGGGASGDGTVLARALHERRLAESFVCLFDPEAAHAAAAAGIGRQARLRAGGKTDRLHGEPLDVEVAVLGIHDGRFEEPEPRHGGLTHMDQGLTAVVRAASGLTLMLTSRRMPPFSLRQLTSFGIEPRAYRAIVVKGVNAPLAAYREVSRHALRVDTPGVTTADFTLLPFRRRRRPLFPFEMDASWPE
jgi:microcystin degradation protein MlrC